ncbi:MAG TPA: hypothetical protein VJZ99_01395 [Patescibacteria group bacterium]|nr:hypothetical protein [Patescibacteria group bacterium]
MKKKYYLLFLLVFLLFPFSSKAHTTRVKDFIYIAKDEIVEGNLYFIGKSVTVEGEVLGDLIGAASNIQINGKIGGDLITISESLKMDGEIMGNLRSIASNTTISGKVEKNTNLLSENLILESNSVLNQDLLFLAVNSEFNGQINGHLRGGANQSLIRGIIGKDVNIKLDHYKKNRYYNSLQIEESAQILGNLSYQSGQEAQIKSQNISGEILQKEPVKYKTFSSRVRSILYLSLSSFLLALFFFLFLKDKTKKLNNIIIKNNRQLFLPGIILLITGPFIFIALLMTVIAIPLAIIFLALWILAMYLGKVLIALSLSTYASERWKIKMPEILQIFLSVLIISILLSLPYLGGFFSLISAILGLGLAYHLIKKKNVESQS